MAIQSKTNRTTSNISEHPSSWRQHRLRATPRELQIIHVLCDATTQTGPAQGGDQGYRYCVTGSYQYG